MITRIVTLVALVLLTTAPAATAQEQPRMGGVLKAGRIGEPPTLDLHATTAKGVRFHNGKEMTSADVVRETDPKKRRAIVEKVQALFYEDIGRIKFGDYFDLWVTRKEVRGFKPGPYLYFWNAWIAK